LALFFRRVEVTGLESIPVEGGGVVIAWHPNGLIDPALILTRFPRRIVFGAREGLFKWPGLGRLMRSLGTVPIYRRKDGAQNLTDKARQAANRDSLESLATEVARGSFAALFPEGASHDQPFLLDLKTGAARLYYQACDLTTEGEYAPVIVPVGLHYDKKSIFGSSALVEFHPPIPLAEDLAGPISADMPEEETRGRVSELTRLFDGALHETVRATESWEIHHLMNRARKLVRAERAQEAHAVPGKPGMEERVLGFSRLWEGYRERLLTHPVETQRILERLRVYDDEMRTLGVEDHELDRDQLGSPWQVVSLVMQFLLIYLVLPPLLVVGWLVNLPTALATLGIAKASANKIKDEASVKLLFGIVAFPVTWLLVAILVGFGQLGLARLYPVLPEAPILTGVIAFLVSAAGGILALQYQRRAREVLRSLRVRVKFARKIDAIRLLRVERGELFRLIMGMAEGLDLPGVVAPDGRIIAGPGSA